MPALASPDTIASPLTAADLDAARRHSIGRIFYLRRAHIGGRDTCTGQCETRAGCDCAPLMPAGLDQQGRYKTRDWHQWPDTVVTDYDELHECAIEGGWFAEPVPALESMLRYRRTVAGVRWGIALATLLGLAGYLVQALHPLT